MSVLARLPIMRLIFRSIAPEMELVHAETDLAEKGLDWNLAPLTERYNLVSIFCP